MLHHIAGAIIQDANLVTYNSHPSKGWQTGRNKNHVQTILCMLEFHLTGSRIAYFSVSQPI